MYVILCILVLLTPFLTPFIPPSLTPSPLHPSLPPLPPFFPPSPLQEAALAKLSSSLAETEAQARARADHDAKVCDVLESLGLWCFYMRYNITKYAYSVQCS